MKHLVYYRTDTIVGRIDCEFIHFPPTFQDILDLEKDISERFCEGQAVLVTNWVEIADEQSVSSISTNISIKDTVINQNDTLKVTDEYGTCIYKVKFGEYSYDGKTHIGWYILLDSIEENYPQDHIMQFRLLADLAEDTTIKNFEVVSVDSLEN